MATSAMSALMVAWQLISGGGRLAPAVVAERAFDALGGRPSHPEARVAAQTAAHFAFGAGADAAYWSRREPSCGSLPARSGCRRRRGAQRTDWPCRRCPTVWGFRRLYFCPRPRSTGRDGSVGSSPRTSSMAQPSG